MRRHLGLTRRHGTWALAFWALFVVGVLVLLGTIIELPPVPQALQVRPADAPL